MSGKGKAKCSVRSSVGRFGVGEKIRLFFPRAWFENTVVKQLKKVNGLQNLEFGKMLRWLGI